MCSLYPIQNQGFVDQVSASLRLAFLILIGPLRSSIPVWRGIGSPLCKISSSPLSRASNAIWRSCGIRSRQTETPNSRSSEDDKDLATSEGHRVLGCARLETSCWKRSESKDGGDEVSMGTSINSSAVSLSQSRGTCGGRAGRMYILILEMCGQTCHDTCVWVHECCLL